MAANEYRDFSKSSARSSVCLTVGKLASPKYDSTLFPILPRGGAGEAVVAAAVVVEVIGTLVVVILLGLLVVGLTVVVVVVGLAVVVVLVVVVVVRGVVVVVVVVTIGALVVVGGKVVS